MTINFEDMYVRDDSAMVAPVNLSSAVLPTSSGAVSQDANVSNAVSLDSAAAKANTFDATAGRASASNANTFEGIAGQATASKANTFEGIADMAEAQKANVSSAASRDAGSQGYDASVQDVRPEASSVYQLNKMTSTDSPYMQQARQRGILEAARRGLTNSSYAAGAAEAARVAAATPFAQQDAGQIYTQDRDNQGYLNRAREFTANAANVAELQNSQLGTQVNLANADAANRAGLQDAALGTEISRTNADRGTNVSLANADARNRAGLQDAALETEISRTNADRGTNVSLANADARNRAGLQDAALETDVSRQNAQADTNVSLANADSANRAGLQDAVLQTEADRANADRGTNVNLANADAANRAGLQDAALGTQTALDNAARQDAANMRAAELSTQVGMANADRTSEMDKFNASEVNRMKESVMNMNTSLNQQFLAGTQALDLATIQGQYNQLISSNETAARLYDSYFNSIAQAMANKDITPDRIAQYVGVQQRMLESGLEMMDAMNGLDLGEIDLPDVSSSGSGSTSRISADDPGTVDIPYNIANPLSRFNLSFL